MNPITKPVNYMSVIVRWLPRYGFSITMFDNRFLTLYQKIVGFSDFSYLTGDIQLEKLKEAINSNFNYNYLHCIRLANMIYNDVDAVNCAVCFGLYSSLLYNLTYANNDRININFNIDSCILHFISHRLFKTITPLSITIRLDEIITSN